MAALASLGGEGVLTAPPFPSLVSFPGEDGLFPAILDSGRDDAFDFGASTATGGSSDGLGNNGN